MKKFQFLFVLFAVFYLNPNILASPPEGGIGDGYIYPAKQTTAKPRATTTYYAKPLHPPKRKAAGPPKPKPQIFKVIIENQNVQKPQLPQKEQIFKIIHLAANENTRASGRSVKILKIIHIKQTKGGQKRDWSK